MAVTVAANNPKITTAILFITTNPRKSCFEKSVTIRVPPFQSHETSPAPCSPSPHTHVPVSNQPQSQHLPGPAPVHRATQSSGLRYTNRDCQHNPYTTPSPRKSRDD